MDLHDDPNANDGHDAKQPIDAASAPADAKSTDANADTSEAKAEENASDSDVVPRAEQDDVATATTDQNPPAGESETVVAEPIATT